MSGKSKYTLWLRLITFMVITALLCQNVVWAGREDSLAPKSVADELSHIWNMLCRIQDVVQKAKGKDISTIQGVVKEIGARGDAGMVDIGLLQEVNDKHNRIFCLDVKTIGSESKAADYKVYFFKKGSRLNKRFRNKIGIGDNAKRMGRAMKRGFWIYKIMDKKEMVAKLDEIGWKLKGFIVCVYPVIGTEIINVVELLRRLNLGEEFKKKYYELYHQKLGLMRAIADYFGISLPILKILKDEFGITDPEELNITDGSIAAFLGIKKEDVPELIRSKEIDWKLRRLYKKYGLSSCISISKLIIGMGIRDEFEKELKQIYYLKQGHYEAAAEYFGLNVKVMKAVVKELKIDVSKDAVKIGAMKDLHVVLDALDKESKMRNPEGTVYTLMGPRHSDPDREDEVPLSADVILVVKDFSRNVIRISFKDAASKGWEVLLGERWVKLKNIIPADTKDHLVSAKKRSHFGMRRDTGSAGRDMLIADLLRLEHRVITKHSAKLRWVMKKIEKTCGADVKRYKEAFHSNKVEFRVVRAGGGGCVASVIGSSGLTVWDEKRSKYVVLIEDIVWHGPREALYVVLMDEIEHILGRGPKNQFSIEEQVHATANQMRAILSLEPPEWENLKTWAEKLRTSEDGKDTRFDDFIRKANDLIAGFSQSSALLRAGIPQSKGHSIEEILCLPIVKKDLCEILRCAQNDVFIKILSFVLDDYIMPNEAFKERMPTHEVLVELDRLKRCIEGEKISKMDPKALRIFRALAERYKLDNWADRVVLDFNGFISALEKRAHLWAVIERLEKYTFLKITCQDDVIKGFLSLLKEVGEIDFEDIKDPDLAQRAVSVVSEFAKNEMTIDKNIRKEAARVRSVLHGGKVETEDVSESEIEKNEGKRKGLVDAGYVLLVNPDTGRHFFKWNLGKKEARWSPESRGKFEEFIKRHGRVVVSGLPYHECLRRVGIQMEYGGEWGRKAFFGHGILGAKTSLVFDWDREAKRPILRQISLIGDRKELIKDYVDCALKKLKRMCGNSQKKVKVKFTDDLQAFSILLGIIGEEAVVNKKGVSYIRVRKRRYMTYDELRKRLVKSLEPIDYKEVYRENGSLMRTFKIYDRDTESHDISRTVVGAHLDDTGCLHHSTAKIYVCFGEIDQNPFERIIYSTIGRDFSSGELLRDFGSVNPRDERAICVFSADGKLLKLYSKNRWPDAEDLAQIAGDCKKIIVTRSYPSAGLVSFPSGKRYRVNNLGIEDGEEMAQIFERGICPEGGEKMYLVKMMRLRDWRYENNDSFAVVEHKKVYDAEGNLVDTFNKLVPNKSEIEHLTKGSGKGMVSGAVTSEKGIFNFPGVGQDKSKKAAEPASENLYRINWRYEDIVFWFEGYKPTVVMKLKNWERLEAGEVFNPTVCTFNEEKEYRETTLGDLYMEGCAQAREILEGLIELNKGSTGKFEEVFGIFDLSPNAAVLKMPYQFIREQIGQDIYNEKPERGDGRKVRVLTASAKKAGIKYSGKTFCDADEYRVFIESLRDKIRAYMAIDVLKDRSFFKDSLWPEIEEGIAGRAGLMEKVAKSIEKYKSDEKFVRYALGALVIFLESGNIEIKERARVTLLNLKRRISKKYLRSFRGAPCRSFKPRIGKAEMERRKRKIKLGKSILFIDPETGREIDRIPKPIKKRKVNVGKIIDEKIEACLAEHRQVLVMGIPTASNGHLMFFLRGNLKYIRGHSIPGLKEDILFEKRHNGEIMIRSIEVCPAETERHCSLRPIIFKEVYDRNGRLTGTYRVDYRDTGEGFGDKIIVGLRTGKKGMVCSQCNTGYRESIDVAGWFEDDRLARVLSLTEFSDENTYGREGILVSTMGDETRCLGKKLIRMFSDEELAATGDEEEYIAATGYQIKGKRYNYEDPMSDLSLALYGGIAQGTRIAFIYRRGIIRQGGKEKPHYFLVGSMLAGDYEYNNPEPVTEYKLMQVFDSHYDREERLRLVMFGWFSSSKLKRISKGEVMLTDVPIENKKPIINYKNLHCRVEGIRKGKVRVFMRKGARIHIVMSEEDLKMVPSVKPGDINNLPVWSFDGIRKRKGEVRGRQTTLGELCSKGDRIAIKIRRYLLRLNHIGHIEREEEKILEVAREEEEEEASGLENKMRNWLKEQGEREKKILDSEKGANHAIAERAKRREERISERMRLQEEDTARRQLIREEYINNRLDRLYSRISGIYKWGSREKEAWKRKRERQRAKAKQKREEIRAEAKMKREVIRNEAKKERKAIRITGIKAADIRRGEEEIRTMTRGLSRRMVGVLEDEQKAVRRQRPVDLLMNPDMGDPDRLAEEARKRDTDVREGIDELHGRMAGSRESAMASRAGRFNDAMERNGSRIPPEVMAWTDKDIKRIVDAIGAADAVDADSGSTACDFSKSTEEAVALLRETVRAEVESIRAAGARIENAEKDILGKLIQDRMNVEARMPSAESAKDIRDAAVYFLKICNSKYNRSITGFANGTLEEIVDFVRKGKKRANGVNNYDKPDRFDLAKLKDLIERLVRYSTSSTTIIDKKFYSFIRTMVYDECEGVKGFFASLLGEISLLSAYKRFLDTRFTGNSISWRGYLADYIKEKVIDNFVTKGKIIRIPRRIFEKYGIRFADNNEYSLLDAILLDKYYSLGGGAEDKAIPDIRHFDILITAIVVILQPYGIDMEKAIRMAKDIFDSQKKLGPDDFESEFLSQSREERYSAVINGFTNYIIGINSETPFSVYRDIIEVLKNMRDGALEIDTVKPTETDDRVAHRTRTAKKLDLIGREWGRLEELANLKEGTVLRRMEGERLYLSTDMNRAINILNKVCENGKEINRIEGEELERILSENEVNLSVLELIWLYGIYGKEEKTVTRKNGYSKEFELMYPQIKQRLWDCIKGKLNDKDRRMVHDFIEGLVLRPFVDGEDFAGLERELRGIRKLVKKGKFNDENFKQFRGIVINFLMNFGDVVVILKDIVLCYINGEGYTEDAALYALERIHDRMREAHTERKVFVGSHLRDVLLHKDISKYTVIKAKCVEIFRDIHAVNSKIMSGGNGVRPNIGGVSDSNVDPEIEGYIRKGDAYELIACRKGWDIKQIRYDPKKKKKFGWTGKKVDLEEMGFTGKRIRRLRLAIKNIRKGGAKIGNIRFSFIAGVGVLFWDRDINRSSIIHRGNRRIWHTHMDFLKLLDLPSGNMLLERYIRHEIVDHGNPEYSHKADSKYKILERDILEYLGYNKKMTYRILKSGDEISRYYIERIQEDIPRIHPLHADAVIRILEEIFRDGTRGREAYLAISGRGEIIGYSIVEYGSSLYERIKRTVLQILPKESRWYRSVSRNYFAYLSFIAVHPNYNSKGVGLSLFKQAFKSGKKRTSGVYCRCQERTGDIDFFRAAARKLGLRLSEEGEFLFFEDMRKGCDPSSELESSL